MAFVDDEDVRFRQIKLGRLFSGFRIVLDVLIFQWSHITRFAGSLLLSFEVNGVVSSPERIRFPRKTAVLVCALAQTRYGRSNTQHISVFEFAIAAR